VSGAKTSMASSSQGGVDASTDSKASRVKPKSARRWAREFALQGLYSYYVGQQDPAMIRLHLEGEIEFKHVDKNFFREMWSGLTTDWATLIAQLQPHLDRAFDEVSPIERGIIIIGAWELQHRLDVPYRVVINEAVELAKTFGGTDGHKWVNGVLDRLVPSLREAEMKAPRDA
jgi:transcription antitermination protein NusB